MQCRGAATDEDGDEDDGSADVHDRDVVRQRAADRAKQMEDFQLSTLKVLANVWPKEADHVRSNWSML